MSCLNIIKYVLDSLYYIKDVASIFLSIVTGVGIIRGFYYLKTYKDKTHMATFTFWLQLKIRLTELSSWLKNDMGLVCNLYSQESKRAWESSLAPDEIRIRQFKENVEETIRYMKTTPDQMPAYNGWMKDYNILIDFLNDVVQYDICNSSKYFKFTEQKSEKDMEDYCNKICQSIDNLCDQINKKQIEIEKELFE